MTRHVGTNFIVLLHAPMLKAEGALLSLRFLYRKIRALEIVLAVGNDPLPRVVVEQIARFSVDVRVRVVYSLVREAVTAVDERFRRAANLQSTLATQETSISRGHVHAALICSCQSGT